MTDLSAASFVAAFPEFATAPLATISFWLGTATSLVNPDRWGASLQTGVFLLTAHYTAMALRAASGASPGTGSVGVLASASVGGVSKSYDTTTGGFDDAGDLNLTTYGRQYARLARMFGSGGMQL